MPVNRKAAKVTFCATGKTQSDGAFTIDVSSTHKEYKKAFYRWQIQVEPSATPSGGTVTISVKPPDSSNYTDLSIVINLVSGPYMVSVEGVFDDIKFTPDSFDADKTYDVNIVAWR